MLINDNHNWYLLIAKDEKPESQNDEHTHTSVITGLACVCVSSPSLYIQAISKMESL